MSLRTRKRRARLSMTSLIDVIFLLLLFFMLSSTFSRFGEVELTLGGNGVAATSEPPDRVLFLRITNTGLSLNGQPVANSSLEQAINIAEGPATVIVSVTRHATAQTLAEALIALGPIPELTISVLEAS